MSARVPPGTRVYGIGDIHGRADLLAALRRRILDDAAADPPARAVAVYLGDYVDRGPASRQVIDLLVENPLPGFEEVRLKGNHEAFVLDFLEDDGVGPHWFANGGLAMLASYGVAADAGHFDGALQARLRRAMPARHLAFLRALGLYHVEGDYLFVHAGIRPGVALERQTAGDLLWIRDEFLRSSADHGHVVVHGHSIVRRVEECPNRIGIDTGAFYSGILTCLVLEDDRRRVLQTSPAESDE